MRNLKSSEVNPIVFCKLACAYSGVSLFDLRHGNRSRINSFTKGILAYGFVRHAGYSLMGAAQCLNVKDHGSISHLIKSIESGRYDHMAQGIDTKCVNAVDYAGIVYERALNTPLPKHRRAVAS